METNKQKALKALGITAQMYDELINDFIEQFDLNIDNLYINLEKEDFERIHQIGHLIKGSSANLRLEEISQAAKKIEHSNGNKELIKDQLIVLKDTFMQLKHSIDKQ